MKPKPIDWRPIRFAVLFLVALALVCVATVASPLVSAKAEGSPSATGYDLPFASSDFGRVLFVDKR